MKKILTIAAIIAVCGIAAYLFFRNGNEGPKFRTEKVTRGDITETITATGTVNPVTTVLVGTQVSGTVRDIYADFNSIVKRGQLIAQIDPAKFDAEVEQARANLMSAKANLDRAEATFIDTKRTMQRNWDLFAEHLVSQSDLDTAETDHETAKAQVSVSRAQVAQAEASLKIAETNLRYSRILSPVDGIVVSRNVDVGQTVAASFQTPTLFSIARDLTKMQINASVDEADIGKVIEGQDVEFTVDAYPDVMFRGKVAQVRNAPVTVQNVVTYDVILNVDNQDLKLKPGMTANVSVILSVRRDALRVSNAALRFSPAESDARKKEQKKGRGVWVLKDGRPERVPVTTGVSDGMYTELLSEGLGEGQELIVESLARSDNNSRNSAPRPRMF